LVLITCVDAVGKALKTPVYKALDTLARPPDLLVECDPPPKKVVQVPSLYVAVSEPQWEVRMMRKRYSVEQIIGTLREAEALLSQGRNVREISRDLGVTEQTCY
jgi:hypothetical protein